MPLRLSSTRSICRESSAARQPRAGAVVHPVLLRGHQRVPVHLQPHPGAAARRLASPARPGHVADRVAAAPDRDALCAAFIPFVFLLFIFLAGAAIIGPIADAIRRCSWAPEMAGWWAGRTSQFRRYLTGSREPAERTRSGGWLTPAQLALFARHAPRRSAPRAGRGCVAPRARARRRPGPAAGRALPRRRQGTDRRPLAARRLVARGALRWSRS